METRIDESLSKLHAHICGDGNLYIKPTNRSPSSIRTGRSLKPYNRYVVEYTNYSGKLLNQVVEAINKICPKNYVYIGKNRIQARAKFLYILLRDLGCADSLSWKVPNNIIRNPKLRRAWLRAFFDDEGHFRESNIIVSSVNKYGISQVKIMLKREKLNTHLSCYFYPKYSKNPIYVLRVLSNSFERFNKIGFDHPDKIKKYYFYLRKRKNILGDK